MKITLIYVGKTKSSYFQEAEREYLKRLQPYAKITIITAKEAPSPYGENEATRGLAKQKEGLEILKQVPKDSFIITLDEHGKSMTSPQFAQFLGKNRDFEGADLTFIIGGTYGLSEAILAKSKLKLSFSGFTFTHEMIRTLLLEQLYRAFTILSGKKYHY